MNYCKKVFAWEPDEANIEQMKKNLKGCKNIEILPLGMWESKTELHFDMNGGSGSKISDSGIQTISVDSIDHLCCSERVTFIKMDIEFWILCAVSSGARSDD